MPRNKSYWYHVTARFKWAAWVACDRATRHAFLRGCIAAHAENQREYAIVMRGGLS